jgi:hypothetical protein
MKVKAPHTLVCFSPLEAFVGVGLSSNGKANIVFNSELAAQPIEKLRLRCGQCIGCRLSRSVEWAIRCMHEASCHTENCFITLTYDPEFLPSGETLVKKHFQDSMKRLRQRILPQKVRYYMCGEYGEARSRPHYHACLFGYDFPDKEVLSDRDGQFLYTSELLSDVWGKGFCSIGDLTFDSAAYCARYILKKSLGLHARKVDPETGLTVYERLDSLTGEVVPILPEYTNMSLKPGIGAEHFAKFPADYFPSGFVVRDGKKFAVPRYYFRLLERMDPDLAAEFSAARKAFAVESAGSVDSSRERLKDREKVVSAFMDHSKQRGLRRPRPSVGDPLISLAAKRRG